MCKYCLTVKTRTTMKTFVYLLFLLLLNSCTITTYHGESLIKLICWIVVITVVLKWIISGLDDENYKKPNP